MVKLGTISTEAKSVQALINSQFRKAPLKADGHFGPKSKHYLEVFQRAAGLQIDGIAGPKTMAALKQLRLSIVEETRAPAKAAPKAVVVPALPVHLARDSDYPPFAHVLAEKMLERGVYKGGGPAGALVHFTAGHDGARKTMLGGIKSRYTYWCIQRDGGLYCAHRAKYWGMHAGESKWLKLAGGVSDDIIGIEMNAYGAVKPVKGKPGRYVTYFGLEIGEDQVRYTPGRDNQAKGYYHVYTPEQEATLLATLVWLAETFPSTFKVENIVGHDECAGMKGLGYFRKVDPGAALSCTMSELRAKVQAELDRRKK